MCDNFTPQSFKPTQCANCFLLVTDHPNAPEELLAAERERLAKLEEQKAKVKEHQADLDRLAEIEKEHERKIKEEEERIFEAKRLARIEMEEEAAKAAEAKRKQEEEMELKIAADLGMIEFFFFGFTPYYYHYILFSIYSNFSFRRKEITSDC